MYGHACIVVVTIPINIQKMGIQARVHLTTRRKFLHKTLFVHLTAKGTQILGQNSFSIWRRKILKQY